MSKWSVLHFVGQALLQSIYGVIGLLTVNASIEASGEGSYLWIGIAVMVLIIVSGAFLKYIFYSYRVLDDGIQVKHGVLFKKQLDLKFERIQNVNIKHPFYYRPLGLVVLRIDGAGSKDEEVSIAALTLDSAQAIRHTVQIKKGQIGSQSDASDAESGNATAELDHGLGHGLSEGEAFYTRSFGDLVIHGLTNNRAWIVVGGLFGFLQSTPFSISDALDILQEVLGALFVSESFAYLAVLFTVSFVLAVVLTAFFSVFGSILAYYGFTLYRSDKSLMVHRGLINKQEINMQKSRVQSVYFRQDWLDLVLKRVNVIFEQISHSEHDMATVDNSKKILVPSAREWERCELAREIFRIPEITELDFQGISKRFFYKNSIIWSIPYFLATAVFFFISAYSYLTAVVVIWVMHVVMIYMTWLRAGLAMSGDYVVVRQGIVGIDYIVFPAYKLQAVDHVQSILMKRRDLSNIAFHTASRSARVAYLPTQFVKDLVDYCVYSVETDARSWM